jgi:hypothetical protein
VTERDDDETELNRCRMCDRLWPDLPCLTCGACFHCASDDCDRCVRRIEFLRSEAAPPRPVAEPAPSPAPDVAVEAWARWTLHEHNGHQSDLATALARALLGVQRTKGNLDALYRKAERAIEVLAKSRETK